MVSTVYIDTESAVSSEFLQAIGVDTDSMLYVHLETIEDIFDTIETIVTKIRESSKDKLVTILVDSLVAASTKVEMDADFDKDGWATSKKPSFCLKHEKDYTNDCSSKSLFNLYQSVKTKIRCDVWRSLDYFWW